MSRFPIVLAMASGGALMLIYGLFAIVYRGDGGADTYVSLAGRDLDADAAGTVTTLVGLGLLVGAGWLLGRRRRQRGERASG